MKHSALSFGLIKGQINYIYAVFSTVMSNAIANHILEQAVNL